MDIPRFKRQAKYKVISDDNFWLEDLKTMNEKTIKIVTLAKVPIEFEAKVIAVGICDFGSMFIYFMMKKDNEIIMFKCYYPRNVVEQVMKDLNYDSIERFYEWIGKTMKFRRRPYVGSQGCRYYPIPISS